MRLDRATAFGVVGRHFRDVSRPGGYYVYLGPASGWIRPTPFSWGGTCDERDVHGYRGRAGEVWALDEDRGCRPGQWNSATIPWAFAVPRCDARPARGRPADAAGGTPGAAPVLHAAT